MKLHDLVLTRDNDYGQVTLAYEARVRKPWVEHAPFDDDSRWARISIVIPARNMEYALERVLDALAVSVGAEAFEVIVVDDGSEDNTSSIALDHRMRPVLVRMPKRFGPSVARNLGTAVAKGDTILFLDADMVLPPHVVHEHSMRAHDLAVNIGFRHNVATDDERVVPPVGTPNIEADHRVNWKARPGTLLYSGSLLDKAVNARPMAETNDLRLLGFGQRFYDWDLPRMVVTAMVSMPRAAVMEVGGFDPDFADGWGVEDTHLGAKLIGYGLKVVPVKQTVGFHIDPPNAEQEWARKLEAWPRNIEIYKGKLLEEVAFPGRETFLTKFNSVLSLCEVHRS